MTAAARPTELDAVRYEVLAAPRSRSHDQVLKHGDTFAVFDQHGDIRPDGHGEEGLYHEGTRFLSRLELRLAGAAAAPAELDRPDGDNARLSVDLTNPDLGRRAAAPCRTAAVHICRAPSCCGDGALPRADPASATTADSRCGCRSRCASRPTSPTSSRSAASRRAQRGTPCRAGRRPTTVLLALPRPRRRAAAHAASRFAAGAGQHRAGATRVRARPRAQRSDATLDDHRRLRARRRARAARAASTAALAA